MNKREQYDLYDEKMNEVYNNSPIYDSQELFDVYRAHRRVILSLRENAPTETIENYIDAFVAMADSLRPKADAPDKIYLWDRDNQPMQFGDFTNNKVPYEEGFRPYLYALKGSQHIKPKGAMLCVAGGKQGRTIVNEGLGVALEYQKKGYQCFVLHNRVNVFDNNGKRINGLDSGGDVARAIRYIRAHASEYGIDPDRVAASGYSNGGLTIENCILYYSGSRSVRDYFENYVPDELDKYKGSPDVFVCVYGQRRPESDFDWTDVEYPPVFEAAGTEDETGACSNMYRIIPELLEHNVEMEVHSFSRTPHGRAAYNLIWEKEDHKNFDMFIDLSDHFIQNVYSKRSEGE